MATWENRLVGDWIVITPGTVLLLIGDLAVIIGVLAWGLVTHNIDPIAHPIHATRTVLPFVLGWLIFAPVAGAYSRQALGSVRTAVVGPIAGWLGAALIGSAIRATPLIPGAAPPIFVFVTIAFGLVVLVPWRILATIIAAHRSA